MERFNIMWTGGLDSTYTMIVYSRYDIEIQPYYLRNGRKSEKYELAAMDAIRELLLKHPETKAKILPLIVIRPDEIPDDEVVTNAFRGIKKKADMGSQYEWIARYVRNHDIKGLFYSPVKPICDASKLRKCLEDNGGVLTKTNCTGRTYYVIDMDNATEDLKVLFGDFNMSETFDLTKSEEEKILRDMGYGDIVEKTWFCHTPVLGHPCGYCHPCETTVESGQEWRFSKAQLKRYAQHKAGVPEWKVRLGSYIDVLLHRN